MTNAEREARLIEEFEKVFRDLWSETVHNPITGKTDLYYEIMEKYLKRFLLLKLREQAKEMVGRIPDHIPVNMESLNGLELKRKLIKEIIGDEPK